MATIDASTARRELADLLNRVAYGDERVVLSRRGKNVAALVSMDDLELLEDIQDQLDIHDALDALREAKKKGTRPAVDLWRKLGV